jgi:hypothetical protein
MTTAEIAGLAIIFVGLLMMLAGIVAALGEARRRGTLSTVSDFIDKLAKLVEVLSEQRTSIVLFTFGTLLVFIGGIVLGVTGLTK